MAEYIDIDAPVVVTDTRGRERETTVRHILEMNKGVYAAADVRPVKWIPVTERLPDTGVDVLVKFPHNMAVASIDIGEWVVNSGDGWCTDINLAGGEKNPTHWMPLPEPPKEET